MENKSEKNDDDHVMPNAIPLPGNRKLGEMEAEGKLDFGMSKLRILKNVAVVSIAFLFLFTGFQSLSNLQSSLNRAQGIGTGGLAILYAALIISCMFIPPILIARLGCKWTVALAMLTYAIYVGANFYATWAVMVPASIIIGLGAAPLWSAKCTYLTQTGIWYSKMTGKSEDAVINAFFGIFFMVFQSAQIWGNLISSLVLKQETEHNITESDIVDHCGANFYPKYKFGNASKNLDRPDDVKVYTLLGIYLGCELLASLIIVFLLDTIKLEKDKFKKGKPSLKLLLKTGKHLFDSTEQKLLVPLTMYSGLEQGFVAGDFTRSYVSCTIGIWNVGYVMICLGVVDAICSLSFGRLVQYVGHIPFFVLAALTHGSIQLALLFWIPTSEGKILYFVFSALWGMGDAVIQTQINALYGYLFSDNTEAAFANYRLWESMGFILAFAYSEFLVTRYKLYVCLGFLALGITGYALVELRLRRSSTNTLDINQSTN